MHNETVAPPVVSLGQDAGPLGVFEETSSAGGESGRGESGSDDDPGD